MFCQCSKYTRMEVDGLIIVTSCTVVNILWGKKISLSLSLSLFLLWLNANAIPRRIVSADLASSYRGSLLSADSIAPASESGYICRRRRSPSTLRIPGGTPTYACTYILYPYTVYLHKLSTLLIPFFYVSPSFIPTRWTRWSRRWIQTKSFRPATSSSMVFPVAGRKSESSHAGRNISVGGTECQDTSRHSPQFACIRIRVLLLLYRLYSTGVCIPEAMRNRWGTCSAHSQPVRLDNQQPATSRRRVAREPAGSLCVHRHGLSSSLSSSSRSPCIEQVYSPM